MQSLQKHNIFISNVSIKSSMDNFTKIRKKLSDLKEFCIKNSIDAKISADFKSKTEELSCKLNTAQQE